MPRNTQVARQLLLLRRLESPQGATLHDLALALPPDYPKNLRTIRRDLEALEDARVPLVIERVDGQARWKFMEGYCHRRKEVHLFAVDRIRSLALTDPPTRCPWTSTSKPMSGTPWW